MRDIEHKLRVLARIARALNTHGIVWAAGASLLLYLNGRTDHFNDLDLMVLESDVPRLREVLLPMGTLLPTQSNPGFGTRQFIEFSIDGVDVDVLAGFAIVRDGIEYDCALRLDQIRGRAEIFVEAVPLQALSDWQRFYELMGRPEKACLADGEPTCGA